MVLLPFRGSLTGWRIGQRGILKFNKGKYKVLPLGRNNAVQQYSLGANWLARSFAEKDLGLLLDNKLMRSQRCALAAKQVNSPAGLY